MNSYKDKVGFIGRVKLVCRKKDGSIKWEYKGKNKMTYASLDVISGLLCGVGSETAFTYLAVGSGSTAEGNALTALTTEITNHGLARVAATITQTSAGGQTDDTAQFYTVWTASGGSSDTINEIGIFNDPTTGVMLCRKLTGAKTVNSGETLTATYSFTVVAN